MIYKVERNLSIVDTNGTSLSVLIIKESSLVTCTKATLTRESLLIIVVVFYFWDYLKCPDQRGVQSVLITERGSTIVLRYSNSKYSYLAISLSCLIFFNFSI